MASDPCLLILDIRSDPVSLLLDVVINFLSFLDGVFGGKRVGVGGGGVSLPDILYNSNIKKIYVIINDY